MSTVEAATDHDRMRTLGQQFAELEQIVRPYREFRQASADAAEARELAAAETDAEMAEAFDEEARAAAERAEALRARLEQLLVPKDPNEGKDLILEIRAGAGGQEAALWAGDLFEMYRHLADRRRWKTDVLASAPAEIGGYKEVVLGIRGRDAYGRLEARVGRPPCAARAGDRVAGPDPHVHRDRRRDARGRGGGGRDPAGGSRDRRLPIERSRRAVGEHHRLGGADRAQADRDQGRGAGGAFAAPEPREGDALPARAAVPEGARRAAGEGGGRSPVDGRHGGAVREDPHLQLPRGPGHGPSHQAHVPSAGQRAWRAATSSTASPSG